MIIRRAAGDGGGSFVTEIAGDQKIEGAAAPAAADNAGDSANSQGQGNTDQGGEQLPSWTTSASKELRGDPRFKAFAGKYKNSLDDALKHAIDLDENAAGMVKIPGENATDDERVAYRKAIGIPEKPEEYKLTVPKGSTLSAEQVDGFKAICHQHNMDQKTAQKFLEYVTEQSAATVKEYQEKQTQIKADTVSALQKEWGAKYDSEVQTMRRGLTAYSTPELLKDLDESGLGNRLSVIKLFHRLGQLTQEDSALSRGRGSKATGEITPDEVYPSMAKKK